MHERRGEWELAEGHYVEALARGAERRRGAGRPQPRRLAARRVRARPRAGLRGARARAGRRRDRRGRGAPTTSSACSARAARTSSAASSSRASSPIPAIAIAALNNLARDDFAAGELGRAEALLREALELCVAQGDLHHEAALRNNLADVLHHGGRAEESMEELKRAVSGFAAIGGEGEERYPGVWSLVEW